MYVYIYICIYIYIDIYIYSYLCIYYIYYIILYIYSANTVMPHFFNIKKVCIMLNTYRSFSNGYLGGQCS